MYCQKCGKELAENAAFCSACGAPTGSQAIPETAPAKKKSKAPLIISVILCVIVAAGALIMFTPIGKQLTLSKEERIILKACRDIQDDLLAPDSINVMQAGIYYYSDEVEEHIGGTFKDDDGNEYETIGEGAIYISALNKGGGMTDMWCEVQIYENGRVSGEISGNQTTVFGSDLENAFKAIWAAQFESVKDQISDLDAWIDCSAINDIL